MLFNDIVLTRHSDDDYQGTIQLGENFGYQISGPFGQGFNIRVCGADSWGELNFHWKDRHCTANTSMGSYDLTTSQVYRKNTVVAELLKSGELYMGEDRAAAALLCLYRHYYFGTGPFSDKRGDSGA